MASELSFVEYVADQVEADCEVTFKKMFGEYGLWGGGKFFGLICETNCSSSRLKPVARTSGGWWKHHPIRAPSRVS